VSIALTIVNSTRWDSRDIARIVRRGLRAHGLTRCHVIVAYRRAGSRVLGLASVGKRGRRCLAAGWMQLNLDRLDENLPLSSASSAMTPVDFIAREVAATVDHEIYHLRGLNHRQFPKHVHKGHVPWFDKDLIMRWHPRLAAAAPSAEDRRETRLRHAEAMHAKSLKRLKLAKTIEKRWRRRLHAIDSQIKKAARTAVGETR
jgi:hypothetical protein